MMRERDATHREKSRTYQQCLNMGFHRFPLVSWLTSSSLAQQPRLGKRRVRRSRRKKDQALRKVCKCPPLAQFTAV
jgi:hypothetical protein